MLKRFLILFLLLMLLQTVSAQNIPSNILPAAVDAANRALPELGQPVSWSWQLLLNINNSNLGCPLVTGEILPNPISTYRITLNYAAGTYIVFVSADATRTQLCDPKFPVSGLAPTSTPTATPATPIATPTLGSCTLRPASVFTNVRALPQENATLLTTLPENTVRTVIGRLADNTWYLIEEGWVSFSVVVLSGDCGRVQTLNPNNQPVATFAAPGSQNVNTSQYLCQPDGRVYLATRLQRGQGTARIDSGGVPNRLRAEPSINGVFIADIQPGRTLDRLIDGPACNDGYTWWYVEIDGQRGWTAESNGQTGDYYMVPVAGAARPPLAPGRVLEGFRTVSPDIAFSPDGSILALAGSSEIPLWRVADDVRLENNPAPQAAIYGILFHPDGTLLAAEETGSLRFYDINNGSEFVPFEGVLDPKWGATVALHPDGGFIAVSGCAKPGQEADCMLGYARVYDLATEELIREVQGHDYAITGVQFSPDGTLVATLSRDGVWLWDTTTWERTVTLTQESLSGSMAFSPDSTVIAVSVCTGVPTAGDAEICTIDEVRLWDVSTGEVLGAIPHEATVPALAFSPDGQRLVTGSSDGIVYLWDVETLNLITTFEGHTGAIADVEINPAGNLIASISDDNTIRLWDMPAQ